MPKTKTSSTGASTFVQLESVSTHLFARDDAGGIHQLDGKTWRPIQAPADVVDIAGRDTSLYALDAHGAVHVYQGKDWKELSET